MKTIELKHASQFLKLSLVAVLFTMDSCQSERGIPFHSKRLHHVGHERNYLPHEAIVGSFCAHATLDDPTSNYQIEIL